MVVRRPFGNYSAQFSDARTVSYQVYSRLDSPAPAADPALVEPLPADAREAYLQLPRLDPRIRELTREHCWRRSIARRPGAHAARNICATTMATRSNSPR